MKGGGLSMPFVTIRQLEGRTVEQKRKVAKGVTDVIAEIYQVEPDKVIVNFFDMPDHHIAKAGKLLLDQES
jgi:4-oxalocrotonate tautomerase